MKMKHLLACAVAGAFVSTAAYADDQDTFRIDVILEDLDTTEGAEVFERRLERAAHRYCEDNYQGSDRRALRDCEAAVIAAVYEELESRGPIMLASSEGA